MRHWALSSLVLLGLAFGLTGCKEDPCEDTVCLNGVCASGICICDVGYEDEACRTPSRDKFLHSIWYNNRTCSGISDLLQSKIEAGQGGIAEIRIFNLDSIPDTLHANVRGDTAWIPLQVHGLEYIEGIGVYSNGGVVFEYERVQTGGERSDCIAYFSH